MILEENEALERLESPLNLLNRLRRELNDGNPLNRKSSNTQIISIPPTVDKLVEDLEEKLKYGTLKSKAAAIMSSALDELKAKLPEVKTEKLSAIAESMNKIIVAQTTDKKDDNDNKPQIIMYAPQFIHEEAFEVIHVRE